LAIFDWRFGGAPYFWGKNKGSGLEMSTNVQKFDQILQNRGKGDGKGGRDIQKSGRKIYKKSARA